MRNYRCRPCMFSFRRHCANERRRNMHSGAINREYKFKFYLNANHYIIIDGKEGEQHPHTWEFMVHIRMNGQKFVQFDAYEKAIDEYFNQYQNHLINEIEPFDHIIPTLENMSDYFVRAIKKIVQNLDGELVRMESSETPTRSYVINFEHNEDYLESVRRNSDRQMSEIIDEVLDRVIE
ncbi:MAG TPA: 6-pyruvoyl tetrahydrobiopterin synthase [Lachnospiraceae bacterium]|nr:6-pyruvoyl tetrahydrobiopterin synthase [Clostridium sp. AM49-4BH]HCK44446.1 6-pyruvoyl tetrahydrobiopterin synthase [Lachnospiraceae bacterium]HCX93521.1 6-pyruvoyl tetrahydrobiopterin synthase [Lachnospiraceae bacterium]